SDLLQQCRPSYTFIARAIRSSRDLGRRGELARAAALFAALCVEQDLSGPWRNSGWANSGGSTQPAAFLLARFSRREGKTAILFPRAARRSVGGPKNTARKVDIRTDANATRD